MLRQVFGISPFYHHFKRFSNKLTQGLLARWGNAQSLSKRLIPHLNSHLLSHAVSLPFPSVLFPIPAHPWTLYLISLLVGDPSPPQSIEFTPSEGFPGDSVVKNPPANAGDLGSIPGSGRSPGEGIGNSHQYSCLVNLMDRGAWRATVHGVTKSQTWLSDQTTTHINTQLLILPFRRIQQGINGI